MRAVGDRWGIGVMLLAVVLLAAACFQTANVQPNTGLQLAPASTLTPTVTPITVAQAPESLPVITVTALSTNSEGIDTGSLEVSSTLEPQLSAAQIEATNIVIEATSEALSTQEPTPLPTDAATVDGKGQTEEGIVKVYKPNESSGPQSQPADSCIYIVRDGDTLYSIARQYNTTVYTLATLNRIVNSDIISVGQQITIPSCGTELAEEAGETETAGSLVVAAPEITHVVQEGEGLFDIALRYGVTVTSIANANGISDINTVFLGQVLIIPASE